MPGQLEIIDAVLAARSRESGVRSIVEKWLPRGRDDLLQQVAVTLERLALLVYVSGEVAQTLSLDLLLDRIITITTEIIGAERGTIFLNDEESGELYSKIALGGLREEIRFPNHLGIAGSVFTGGQATLVPDAYADPRFNREVDRRTGYRTRNILCAPIRTAEGKIIGVIQLLNRKDGMFGPEDLAVLETIAPQVAAAIGNAQLYRQLEEVRREETRLAELNLAISSELNLRVLLQKIVEAITDLLQAERSTVFLIDRKTNELYSFLAQGLGTTEIRFPSHLGIAGAVFASGETLNIPDAYAHPLFNPAIDRQTGFRTRTILCMPIRNRQGKVLGVTQVVNKLGGPFAPADERRLAAFTSQVSVAIENATLFEEVQNVKNYNESMLQSMSNGVLTLDEDYRIQKHNSPFLQMFKVDPAALEGRLSTEYFAGPNAWIQEKIYKVVNSGKSEITVDTEVESPGGERLSANLTVVPLISVKGEKMGAMLVFENITNEKRVKSTMARYMAKEVAERLLESRESALGGQVQSASVLFSDIRSFTSLTEELGAQETVAMLNEYFTAMVDCVSREGGILDKYIGDAIMAIFGVPFNRPDDSDRSVRAAIAMLVELRRLNRARASAGKRPIAVGIGINTAEVISGNIGSPKRMDYTVIGDGVNLASRLEGSTKYYGAPLLISEFTRRELRGDYRIREVDLVMVKGKSEPSVIYEVLDHYDDRTFPHLPEVLELFHQGLHHYRRREWQAALGRFEEVLRLHPEEKVAAVYADRCRHFQAAPPGDDWTGVWMMTTKN